MSCDVNDCLTNTSVVVVWVFDSASIGKASLVDEHEAIRRKKRSFLATDKVVNTRYTCNTNATNKNPKNDFFSTLFTIKY